jgi:hypothetical protein
MENERQEIDAKMSGPSDWLAELPFRSTAPQTGFSSCKYWRSRWRSGMQLSSTRRSRRVFGPVAQPDRATVS